MARRDQCMHNKEYRWLLRNLIVTLHKLDLMNGRSFLGLTEELRFVKEYRRYTELTDGDI